MGIRDEKDLLPEVAAGEPVPASAFEPEAAEQAAEQARADAIEAAKEALEAYRKADDDLDRLWVLHTNIAAVHYLLANLTSGSEAETHRNNALREYELSIRDQPDRREAEFYQTVMNGLTRTPP